MPHTPEEIVAAKIRLQATSPKPSCSICQDAGFVHPRINGKPDFTQKVSCQCVRAASDEKKHQAMLKYCEIPPEGKHMTFENFRQSGQMEDAYFACLELAERKNLEWVSMTGPTGKGKTHLAIAVCHRWIKLGIPAKFIHAPMLLEELRAGFKKDGDESYQSRYNTFLTAPLLVLDDLGVENPTLWAQEHLDTIVNDRLMNQRTTIITSNLPITEIPFRIADRMKRGGQVINIRGH